MKNKKNKRTNPPLKGESRFLRKNRLRNGTCPLCMHLRLLRVILCTRILGFFNRKIKLNTSRVMKIGLIAKLTK